MLKQSVNGHVTGVMSVTSSFFNRIAFYLAVKCERF